MQPTWCSVVAQLHLCLTLSAHLVLCCCSAPLCLTLLPLLGALLLLSSTPPHSLAPHLVSLLLLSSTLPHSLAPHLVLCCCSALTLPHSLAPHLVLCCCSAPLCLTPPPPLGCLLSSTLPHSSRLGALLLLSSTLPHSLAPHLVLCCCSAPLCLTLSPPTWCSVVAQLHSASLSRPPLGALLLLELSLLASHSLAFLCAFQVSALEA